MSLCNLPDISFAPLSAAEIERDILTAFERIQGKTLYPGDPERLFLEGLAYWCVVQNNLLDQAGKQNLLAYASGVHLDHLGALMGTPRLTASAARCPVRFGLDTPRTYPVLIPAGTRVSTQDGKLFFATEAVATIPSGEFACVATVVAASPGTNANGLVPGQIAVLVDPVAGVSRVANTAQTLGGSDVESDERYRARIQLAPESYTCAGSEGSYRYHALRVHPDIAEVAVWSPKPGHVDVRPVLIGGELPDATLIEAVRLALSADTVRPLTDTVTVAAPELVPYAISGGWWLRRADAALSGSIQSAVSAAVEQFRLWQRSAPGRDINPTRLVALVERAGAKRVELFEPEFTLLKGFQIARETTISLEFRGIEDE